MTITGLYTQNLTLSFNASSSSSSLLTPVIAGQKTGAAGPTATAPTTAPATDTVSISPEAIIKQTVVVTLALAPAAAPAESAQSETREPARGDALFDALDADGDGTVTRDEFVEGARELLQGAGRQGRGHGHHRSDRFDDNERHDRGSARLTRRLERLFDLVDANGDGGVQKAEIAGALQRTRPAQAVTQPSTTSEQPAPVATVIVEPPSTENTLRSQTAPSPAIITVDDPTDAEAAPSATNGQRQTSVSSDPPPAGSFVTVTHITITVAIQQYTTLSTGGSTAPSNTLKTAA
jgi:hypothetical protein